MASSWDELSGTNVSECLESFFLQVPPVRWHDELKKDSARNPTHYKQTFLLISPMPHRLIVTSSIW